jgi:autotransporter passenger strand-loop-strand repeat protein
VLQGGNLNILLGGKAIGTVNSGGTDNVSSGGTAIDTSVANGGVENVYFAGIASGTILSNGSQYIQWLCKPDYFIWRCRQRHNCR